MHIKSLDFILCLFLSFVIIDFYTLIYTDSFTIDSGIGGGSNADPGWWDLCVVAAIDKFTRTTESCGEKGLHGHSLSEREGPEPHLDRLLLFF